MAEMVLGLEITTRDPRLADLCERYWLENGDGGWMFTVRELAQEFGFKNVSAVIQFVTANSTLRDRDGECTVCHKLLFKVASSRSSTKWCRTMCEDCKIAEEKAAQELRASKAAERVKKLQDAFDRAAWRSLDTAELSVFSEFVNTEDWWEARRLVGVSKNKLHAVYEKLLALNLIIENDEGGITLLREKLKTVLDDLRAQRRAEPKSIFDPPPTLQVYRKLAQQHAFVFPDICVHKFVERANVEHLFTERWHQDYFSNCRVDFVVCDPDGKPLRAFDYRGTPPPKLRELNFKRTVLSEVGVPLLEVNSRD